MLEPYLQFVVAFLGFIFALVAYSSAFVSFEVPVTRFLISPNASHDLKNKIKKVNSGNMSEGDFDKWIASESGERNPKIPKRFRIETINWELTGNNEFPGPCPITGEKVIFERVDRYYPSEQNVSLKRWDPNLVEIIHNEITGKNKYYYRMSKASRELIRTGDRDTYNEVPWPYIEAVRERRNVRIADENFRHLSNVRVSGAFSGWGVPRLYSAFRVIFYYMTLLRANQSIAVGKIHDLNIFYSYIRSTTCIFSAAALPSHHFSGQMQALLKAHPKATNLTVMHPCAVGFAK